MKLAFVLISICLSGCAATGVTDSPRPALAGIDTCAPDEEGKARTLSPGKACLARVEASDWLTHVPVRLEAGASYRISVPADQFWYDARYRAAPLAGLDGNRLTNLFVRWKRHPASRWFVLMATVLPDEAPTRTVVAHDVMQSRLYRAPFTGTLAMYPNDASTRVFGWPIFYLNNRGAIWALVEHCDAHCVESERGP